MTVERVLEVSRLGGGGGLGRGRGRLLWQVLESPGKQHEQGLLDLTQFSICTFFSLLYIVIGFWLF